MGDFGLDGPATLTSWSKGQEFSTITGETKPSLTLPLVSCWLFLFCRLLVVDILVKKIDSDDFNSSFDIFSTKLNEVN